MLYICCKSFLQRVHKDTLSAMTWRHWRSQRLFLMLLTRSSTQKSSYLCASPFPRADARNFTFFPPRFPSSHKNPSPKSLLTSLLGDGTVNSCGMQPAAPVLNNRIHWLTRQTWVVFFWGNSARLFFQICFATPPPARSIHTAALLFLQRGDLQVSFRGSHGSHNKQRKSFPFHRFGPSGTMSVSLLLLFSDPHQIVSVTPKLQETLQRNRLIEIKTHLQMEIWEKCWNAWRASQWFYKASTWLNVLLL